MYTDLIAWDLKDDPEGNYHHIAGPGEVTADEVEEVIKNHQGGPGDFSESSGNPLIYGWTLTEKHIVEIYTDESDEDEIIIRPKTAYPVKEYGDLD